MTHQALPSWHPDAISAAWRARRPLREFEAWWGAASYMRRVCTLAVALQHFLPSPPGGSEDLHARWRLCCCLPGGAVACDGKRNPSFYLIQPRLASRGPHAHRLVPPQSRWQLSTDFLESRAAKGGPEAGSLESSLLSPCIKLEVEVTQRAPIRDPDARERRDRPASRHQRVYDIAFVSLPP
ncbi:hypothetical protein E2C01_051341 [Portunus trituberculatus]|uniref:Uncharacterized protein n=1 Tax=Portunus trituberculatus TaxID=210409 RepID=A0A5B7GIU6_PORTR|nr:hypothetical protein [Portunus trituberculatus]